MVEVVRSGPGQDKGDKKSNDMLSVTWRKKVKNCGPDFHSVENHQQVPQWSCMLAWQRE